jgi:very-short-patch-repair endonuclease
VKVGSKSYRPDFAWPDTKIFAEFYGLPFHIGATAVVSDSERLTALSSAGWLPLVFTHASTDRDIVERVVEALARRGVGGENRA